MIIFYFFVCFTFSISYSVFQFHLVYVFQCLHLFFVVVLFQAFIMYSKKAFVYIFIYIWASLTAQLVKNLPAMLETWVRSLRWEDPQEKGKATQSSILAWSMGSQMVNTTERLSHIYSKYNKIYTFLENLGIFA